MSAQASLPVRQSVKLALQWGVFVIASHWALFFTLVLVSFAAQLSFWWIGPYPPVSSLLVVFALYLLNALGLLALMLVTHNEVLRGPSGLNAATLGRGGVRILAYFLDLIAISVLLALSLIALFLGFALLGSAVYAVALPEGVRIVLYIVLSAALSFAYLGLMGRLMLRLPSRAIGQPLRWGRVWALGRNNTLRLIGANALMFVIFLVPVFFLVLAGGLLLGFDIAQFGRFLQQLAAQHARGGTTFLPAASLIIEALIAGLNALLTPIELVVFAAFYSIGYAQLIGNLRAESEGLVSA